MRDLAFRCAIALTGLASLSSCSNEEIRSPVVTYLYQEPIDLLHEIWCRSLTGTADHIQIALGGAISKKGEREKPKLSDCPVPIYVAPPEPRPELTAAQQEYLSNIVVVSAARDVAFFDVVRKLKELSDISPIYLQNDGQSRAFDAYTAVGRDVAEIGYQGDAGNQQMAIWVGHMKDIDLCIYALNGKAIGSVELSEKSHDLLEQLVDENGGAEAVRSDRSLFESMVVAIQADESTPWRCVMGADYQLRTAGWPFIRFEVLGA